MQKRLSALIFSLCFLFAACAGRIGYIALSGTYALSAGYNSYSVVLDVPDVNVYYSDMSLMTNNIDKKVCVIRPDERDIKEVYRLFDKEKRQEILTRLNDKKPFAIDVDDDFKSSILQVYLVKATKNNCSQLVSRQSSGLLRHIPESRGKLKVNFAVDARGRFLSGSRGALEDSGYYSQKGLELSIDKKIQNAVFDSCSFLKTGCAIVMDVKSGKILACVTKPDESCLNKAFGQYSAGSVFKAVTALSAAENGIDLTYDCSGSITVGDSVFSCQNKNRHGRQNLKQALANSCNCYFVNLSLALGAEKILNTAKRLGFDGSTELYNGWNIKNAHLPKLSSVSTAGKTALLSFGQGELTVSPLQICSMMCTIASGGKRYEPSLVVSEVGENKNSVPLPQKLPQRAASRENSELILSYLRYVVSDGTGKAADFNSSSAGKTATAQTGRFENGKEVLNTWFAGVYPYHSPKYAIAVMCDDGTSGAENCCPVFRTIVAKLEKM